jgi:hypothetical protein
MTKTSALLFAIPRCRTPKPTTVRSPLARCRLPDRVVIEADDICARTLLSPPTRRPSARFSAVNRYVGNLATMPGMFPDYKAPIVRTGAGACDRALWDAPSRSTSSWKCRRNSPQGDAGHPEDAGRGRNVVTASRRSPKAAVAAAGLVAPDVARGVKEDLVGRVT